MCINNAVSMGGIIIGVQLQRPVQYIWYRYQCYGQKYRLSFYEEHSSLEYIQCVLQYVSISLILCWMCLIIIIISCYKALLVFPSDHIWSAQPVMLSVSQKFPASQKIMIWAWCSASLHYIYNYHTVIVRMSSCIKFS